jgi:hypothetical protein
LQKSFVADIAGDGQADAAFSFDQGDHLLSVGFFNWQVIDRNVGALAREGDGGARPMPESPPVISAFRPARRPLPQ